jgi:hypothetical protein
MAHSEIQDTAEGETVKRVKVVNKEWRGMIESEVSIVLHAGAAIEKEGKANYFFTTQTDGVNAAKSPMEMFEDYKIDNDLGFVLTSIQDYYK